MSRLIKSNFLEVGQPIEIQEPIIPDDDNAQNQLTDRCANTDKLQLAKNLDKELASAKARAQSIIDSARRKATELHQQAYHKGYSEGFEKGKNDGFEQGSRQGLDSVSEIMQKALDIHQKAIEERERAIKDTEGQIIDLVLDISRKVLGQQAKADRQTVLGPVKMALEKCTRLTNVVMRVAPEDFDTVTRFKAGLLVETQSVSDLDIVVDNALKPGSCIVETDAGTIDTSIDVQMDRIEKTFREMLGYE